jgi:hypothetical protein
MKKAKAKNLVLLSFSGDHQAQVDSDQMVLVMATREAEPREWWPKTFKAELENNFRTPRDLVGTLAW